MKCGLWNYVRDNIDIKKMAMGLAIVAICFGGLNSEAKDLETLDAVNAVKIQQIYKNQESTKYKLTLSTDIQKITDIDGVDIEPERLSGDSVLFYNNGSTKIKAYITQEEYVMVDLDSAILVEDTNKPNILWKYKDIRDNTIYMGLEDVAGLYEIQNVNQTESLRAVFTKMPQNIIVSFDANDIKNEIKIYDVFGNVTTLKIEDITLNVSMATKNVNGDNILLKLQNFTYPIRNVTYMDGREIELVGNKKIEKIYRVAEGTTKVIVNYGNESTIVCLDTDLKGPKAVRVWKNDSGSIILIETEDKQSGIKKITFYNSNTKKEDVVKSITGLRKSETMASEVVNGATHLYVYDGVGNKLKLNLDSIQEDREKPTLTVRYENGQCVIRARQTKSGVFKLKLDNEDLGIFDKCPTSEVVCQIDSLDDVAYIYAYSGVGEFTRLSVDSAMCRCDRIYKNEKGTIISILLEDQRGIEKITDQDGNIIERLFGNTTKVSGAYKVRGNIQSIKIYYGEGKSYNIDLETVKEAPIVTQPIMENDLVTHCVVMAKAGIKRIEYSTGKRILFKTDMPDDVEVNCTVVNSEGQEEAVCVTVYDALGNRVKINEDLE